MPVLVVLAGIGISFGQDLVGAGHRENLRASAAAADSPGVQPLVGGRNPDRCHPGSGPSTPRLRCHPGKEGPSGNVGQTGGELVLTVPAAPRKWKPRSLQARPAPPREKPITPNLVAQ